ncbi:hypothetical protein BBBOND_0105570 [Babesia bigemina]|uniref:Uncharacterized protein n=1 Tax=Babesia bigemina TaxID=5866 RepID=A0A061D0T2_BABBI|nr:hypothetical protein BBBOND_0105570 [Babesia bigemina]CDR94248.1 hypothetical protein BBBOND_0105570 [Babesia bigemina]|eukprot:XP_012766434.1 hypothetical protein BBBOND_0105570 [Babesia bigemina]
MFENLLYRKSENIQPILTQMQDVIATIKKPFLDDRSNVFGALKVAISVVEGHMARDGECRLLSERYHDIQPISSFIYL